MNPLKRDRVSLVLAVLAAAGLAYDAKVHLHLAKGFDSIGSTITQGGLFRVEAAVAILMAVALLVSDDWRVWAGAGMTGLAGVGAVLLYRYYDVGKLGPVPDMYEPVWYPEKTHSAYAEGAVALIWTAREALRYTRARVSAGSAAG